jgi:hypothetical protein
MVLNLCAVVKQVYAIKPTVATDFPYDTSFFPSVSIHPAVSEVIGHGEACWSVSVVGS